MQIGVPKEIKSNENRVALAPSGVEALITAGHSVWVEIGAGSGSGFSDAQYSAVGARISPDAAHVWSQAELIVKGIDAKGRVQSVYSDSHALAQAAIKFARTNELRKRAPCSDRTS